MTTGRRLLAPAAVYAASGALNALVAFFLLPVLTRALSPSDYGIVETVTTIVGIATGVVIVGGNTLLTREYFRHDSTARGRMLGTFVTSIFVCGLTVAALVFVGWRISPGLWGLVPIPLLAVMLALCFSAATAIYTLAVTLLQLERRPLAYALVVNGRTALDVGASLVAVLVMALAWRGRILGMGAAATASLVVAAVLLRRRGMRLVFDRIEVKLAIIAGLPFVLAHLSSWTNEAADRLILNRLLGLSATGIYSIGYRFGMVMTLVETGFGLAWAPYFYERMQLETDEARRALARVAITYLGILSAVCVIYTFVGPALLRLVVAPRFQAAAVLVAPVAWAYAFAGVWKMFAGYLIHDGRTALYARIIVIAAAINIILVVRLVPVYGMQGAAWATFTSFGCGAAMTAVAAMQRHGIHWRNAWQVR